MANRLGLKARLWRERLSYTVNPPRPLCDVCGEPLGRLGRADLHESIVPRRVAMGWPKEQRGLIYVAYNCHLLHRKCHKQAHADPDLMVAIQVCRYGFTPLKVWVDTLPFRVPYNWWHRGLDERTARLMVERRAPWAWLERHDVSMYGRQGGKW